MKIRQSELSRKTNECEISICLHLDGRGEADISTSIGFLDHLIGNLTKHAGFNLNLTCRGDLVVDDHHTVEDCALSIGAALDQALGERRGIARFGWSYAPLDEALARVVVDLSGRPYADINLGLSRETLGGLAAENLTHFLQSLAAAGRFCLHVDLIKGQNDHHRAEAAFKGLALALRQATGLVQGPAALEVPSTKGVL